MIRILFVCHGNICRSTMAQYVFQYLAQQRGVDRQFYIDSAATSTEELGNGPHPGTRRRLAEAGIPCGDHRARRLTAQDYDRFDLLIGMDEANLRNMKYMLGGDPHGKISALLDYADRTGQSIADPWYTHNFDETFDDVMAGCSGLLAHLLHQNS